MQPWFRTTLAYLALGFLMIIVNADANARDVIVPAGTVLHCTLNEPNFSTATVEAGDPVVCHLREVTEFGQQAFPRGAYLVGHLESAKDPGHFFGKGNLKLQFDRIGLPSGDIPLATKVIGTRGYKVDKEGKIAGKGHAKRDVVEWMLPPLWPWKVIMLPARGPRPKLKGETDLSLRLMDDVQIPQIAQNSAREPHSFFRRESEAIKPSTRDLPQAVSQGAIRCVQPPCQARSFGPGWHFFVRPQRERSHDCATDTPEPTIRETPSTDQVAHASLAASYTKLIPRSTTAADRSATGIPVLVLQSGTLLATVDCEYQEGRIAYTLADGEIGELNSDQINWTATVRANSQLGLRLTLRSERTR